MLVNFGLMSTGLSGSQKVCCACDESNVLTYFFLGSSASLSPDGYIQAALQLTYCRLHGSVTATYETASTRLYQHGRTETIRSLTPEMAKFVYSMLDEGRSVRFSMY